MVILTRSIACSSRAEFSVQSRMKMCEAAVRFRPAIVVEERRVKKVSENKSRDLSVESET